MTTQKGSDLMYVVTEAGGYPHYEHHCIAYTHLETLHAIFTSYYNGGALEIR